MLIHRIVVSALMENVYIAADEESRECIIVDPGAEGERILTEVERLGLTVKVIVNTHAHVDHVGAVAAVKERTGASYGIHSRDIPLLKEAASSSIVHMIPEFSPPPEPDIELKAGGFVEAGSLRFKVLETPGHTPGGICFYGHDTLFTGDTLFQGSIGRFDSPGGDGRQLLTSIFGELVPLPDDTRVLPGHLSETTIGEEKQSNPFLQTPSIDLTRQ